MKDKIANQLVESALISQAQLEIALSEQTKTGGSLGYNLVKTGAISEKAFSEFLSQTYQVASVELDDVEPDEHSVELIPSEVAQKFQVVPIKREGRVLTVAMANPDNIFAIDDIKFITGLDVCPVVATETAIKRAIDRFYESADSLAEVMKDIQDDFEIVEEMDDDSGLAEAQSEDAPVVKLVNSLIADAVNKGASDIHVEPFEKKLRVRYRIDGVLHEMMSPPIKMKGAITSRLKIMAELDIAEKRVPQDGRIKIRDRQQEDRSPRELAPDDLRREDRDANPRQDQPADRSRRSSAFTPRLSRSSCAGSRCPTGWCSSPARPAAAKRRPSTRPSTRSTFPSTTS